MKAHDLSHPSFHAPLKAAVTFKPHSPSNAATRARPPVAFGQKTAKAHAAVASNTSTAITRKVVALRTKDIDTEVARLTQTREAHSRTVFDAIDDRTAGLAELEHDHPQSPEAVAHLLTELVGEFSQVDVVHALPRVANSNSHPSGIRLGVQTDAALNEMRALNALRLIEKIDLFVKSQRPTLALTLNNTLAAKVEVERVGPREVALTVRGWNGPPSPESVTHIREEMEARGLKISALSVA